jgi:hypothetical protein
MSKYFDLTKYLANLEADVWEASFDEVEQVLGRSLPESARQHRPWWANQGRAQSSAWQGAGWKTAKVDLANERVTFVYVGDGVDRDVIDTPKLTIADAKAGLAASFNVPIEAVEIMIRG